MDGKLLEAWLHETALHAKAECEHELCDGLRDARNELLRLRKILAFVPAGVVIKAKEEAGYGTPVNAT